MAMCIGAVLWIDSLTQMLVAAYGKAERQRQRVARAEWRLTLYAAHARMSMPLSLPF